MMFAQRIRVVQEHQTQVPVLDQSASRPRRSLSGSGQDASRVAWVLALGYALAGELPIEMCSVTRWDSFACEIPEVGADHGLGPRTLRELGYVPMGSDVLDMTRTDPSMAGAAGGNAMVSTTEDLARFITVLLDGKLFESPQTLDEMLDFVDAPDEEGVPYWYGLGLERYDINGVSFIGHSGGAVGYSTVMFVAPDARITLVASNNGYGLAPVFLDLMIPAFEELAR